MFVFFFLCCLVTLGSIVNAARMRRHLGESEETNFKQARSIDQYLYQIKELEGDLSEAYGLIEQERKTSRKTILEVYDEIKIQNIAHQDMLDDLIEQYDKGIQDLKDYYESDD